MQDPKPIKLTGEELEKVRQEITESNLSESTKTLLCGILQMCAWLYLKLEHSKVSIKRLKRLFFINMKNVIEAKANLIIAANQIKTLLLAATPILIIILQIPLLIQTLQIH